MPVSHFRNGTAAVQGATRGAVRQAGLRAPATLAADPGDLVTRALDILADEVKAWQTRLAKDLPPGRTR
jgi:hypothetical protein